MKKILLMIPFAPEIVFAAPQNLTDISVLIINLVNKITPILVTLAFVIFLWGMGKSIIYTDDADAQKDGRMLAVYGTIALFIMTGIWGIVAIARNTFFGY